MASLQDSVGRVIPHKDYFLRGGDMKVLVGNRLYCVHSYFFYRESLVWRSMLDGPGDDEEHRSTDSPFTLDDVKSEDFDHFLWAIYNPHFSLYDAPAEVWLSILNLAHRWTFSNMKELAIRELEKIDIEPIEKIAAYHEYKINKTLLLPAYIAVCKRDKPISLAEGNMLGMETVLRIADARERARQQAAESGIRSPTVDDFEDLELEDMVREVFGVPPRPMSPTRHSRNSSAVLNGFGGMAMSNGFIQKANGDTNLGMNGHGQSATHNNLRVSTSSTDPAGVNGSTPNADNKPQVPLKDDKQPSLEPNGAQASSASADNKGGAGSKLK